MNGSEGMPASIPLGLAVYFLLVVLLNLGFAIRQFRRRRPLWAGVWGLVAVVFLIHAVAFFTQAAGIYRAENQLAAADEQLADARSQDDLQAMEQAEQQVEQNRRTLEEKRAAVWVVPHGIRDAVDAFMGPVSYFVVSVVGFVLFLYFRRFLTLPGVAWSILNVSLLASGWAVTDPSFRLIVTKPDNVPIVLLIFVVGFFTWLAFRKAVVNDSRIAAGEPPVEKAEDDKVLVWPDLVYTELISMIAMTFILVVWSVCLKAPLEPPASTAKAPNPSKAPWYFLGLQEMLVYYDPWLAGVVFPTLIIVGLIAIPYIDYNQKGNGYFTFGQRRFAVTTFVFGFVILWVTLIVLGTFLRGPNWNFFGPFEEWDPHKVLPLNNVNLSQMVWLPLGKVTWLDEGQGILGILRRESPGIILILAYFILVPPLLAKTVLRSFFIRMGFVRFFLLVNLMQFMAALPIKMILRWTLNLKYIVYIPEAFFNI
jgi:hypothetical protein